MVKLLGLGCRGVCFHVVICLGVEKILRVISLVIGIFRAMLTAASIRRSGKGRNWRVDWFYGWGKRERSKRRYYGG